MENTLYMLSQSFTSTYVNLELEVEPSESGFIGDFHEMGRLKWVQVEVSRPRRSLSNDFQLSLS